VNKLKDVDNSRYYPDNLDASSNVRDSQRRRDSDFESFDNKKMVKVEVPNVNDNVRRRLN